jgi:hypothetical protein
MKLKQVKTCSENTRRGGGGGRMKLSKQKKKNKMLFGMVKIEGKQQGHLQSCIF